MLSVIIPSKHERFLNNTIEDVLSNATGEIEIYAMLDGEDVEDKVIDPRVQYHVYPKGEGNQKRHMINWVMDRTDSEYMMALDAHCMLGHGFDEILIENHQPNWVQIPRRLRLDADNWRPQIETVRPPIDYEYHKFRDFKKGGIHGYKWDSRTLERIHIPVDETMTFQGSCYFMTRDWFRKIGLMQIEGFGGFTQEAEEITLKTWMAGGKVMTNKNTWYAHLHKGKKYGRMYNLNWDEKKIGDDYAFDFFVRKNPEFFKEHIKRFWPIPGWPENWEDYLG